MGSGTNMTFIDTTRSVAIISLAMLLAWAGPLHAGRVVWVEAKTADLKSDRNMASDTIEKMAAGTKLNVIMAEEKWLMVFTDAGRQGWISKADVSDIPPPKGANTEEVAEAEDDLLIEPIASNVHGEQMYAARSMRGEVLTVKETAPGHKGLSAESIRYSHIVGTPLQYQNALHHLLNIETPPADIDSFLKSASIGP